MLIDKIKYIIFLIIFLVACEKDDVNKIPGFIKIEEIILNENTTDNISDAWVYINDQLQGVYELPVHFPVLELGKKQLRIRAGIKNNGIASSRAAYPFYTSYIEEIELSEDQEISIYPEVTYLSSTNILNDDSDIILEKTNFSDTSIVFSIEENCNAGFLTDSLITFEISTQALEGLPQDGSPVYLELDYKCNTQFLAGMFINYSPTIVKKDLLWVNPKEEWNKIYINLTGTINEGVNAPSFSIFIGMQRDFNLTRNELYFKNFKVVY